MCSKATKSTIIILNGLCGMCRTIMNYIQGGNSVPMIASNIQDSFIAMHTVRHLSLPYARVRMCSFNVSHFSHAGQS